MTWHPRSDADCCSFFLSADEAIHFLERSIDADFAHREWVDNDTDSDNIREHPRFAELAGRLDEVS